MNVTHMSVRPIRRLPEVNLESQPCWHELLSWLDLLNGMVARPEPQFEAWVVIKQLIIRS